MAGLLFLAMGTMVKAQQYPMRYMFDQYKYMLNPAALSVGEGIGLNGNFSSNQFDGTSNNSLIGFGVEGGFFYNNMAIGLTFAQELEGILQNTNAQLQYAYRVKIQENHLLTFGISAGMVYQGQKTDEILTGDYSDPLIGESYTGFAGGFGINYQWKGLALDVSIPSYTTINSNDIPLFASASYNIPVAKDWAIKPIAMYSAMNPENDNLFDFRVQGSYKNYAWLQAGYRTSEELLFAAGGEYKDFKLGFAYGFNLSNYGDLNKGNFEIVVGYRFKDGKMEKHKSQKQVNTETQESLSKISTDLSDLKKNDEKQNQELEEINTSVKKLNDDLNKEFKGSLNQIKEQVQDIQRSDLEQVDETKIQDKGYFVVIYSTKTLDDAQKIVERVKKQNVKSFIVRDTRRNYFYIYTEVFNELNPALEQSKKEREKGFSGAWVLVVK